MLATCWSCSFALMLQKKGGKKRRRLLNSSLLEHLLGVEFWAVPHFAEADISAKTINRLSLPPR